MKKNSLLLILCAATLFVSCGGSNNAPRVITDLERDGLRGDACCFIDNVQMKVYNSKGWVIETYTPKNSFSAKEGLRLSTEYIYADDSCTQVARKEYTYNYKGEPSIETIADTLTVEQRMLSYYNAEDTEYTFNSNGDLIKSYKVTGTDGEDNYKKKEYITEYIYDEQNKLIEKANSFYRYVAGEQDMEYALHTYVKSTFEYNKEGDVVKQIDFDKDGAEIVTLEYHYTYDDNKNWISHSNPYGGKATEREVFNAPEYEAYKQAAAAAAKNEDFNKFLKMFAGSKNFQIQRIIKFPIGKITYYELDGSTSTASISKSDWNNRNYFNDFVLGQLKNPEMGKIIKNSEDSYTCEVSSMEGGSISKFERRDGKWYLVDFNTSSF